VELIPGADRMCMRAGVGWQPGTVGGATLKAGPRSLIAHTIRSAEPVVSPAISADPRFDMSPVLRAHHVVSGATVVIAGRTHPFGGLGAFSTRRQLFSHHDLSFMQGVANVLGAAVARSEFEAGLRWATDSQRQRIARDLRDSTLDELGGVLALAQAAPDERLGSTIERACQQLRRAIHDLCLEDEEDGPLGELLAATVALHETARGDGATTLELGEGTPEMTLGHRRPELLRIVGEALTNARRHADALHTRVHTWAAGDRLFVEVSDDGCGFEANGTWGGPSSGLAGMRERASLIDAGLSVLSTPGSGTRVRLDLPVADRERGAVRVLLVEDHVAVREAIADILRREPGFAVTGEAGSLADAKQLLDDVDVALVDLGLPDGYGGEVIRALRAANPSAQALVLTASLDREEIARAVEAGAAGVLNKTVQLDEVVGSIRRLRAGETLIPPDETVELLRFAGRQREQALDGRAIAARITAREREVLEGLAEGLDSQGIADRLHISVRTERNHVASILAKLGAHSRLEALVLSVRLGLVAIR
jgi:DNA-binding NarL/FixJ family response regulator/signal transduction histidine kinase